MFNPTTQGEKFDPNGEYVRRWCPELAKLPAKWIHQPDKAPAAVLRAAGVEIGRDYPAPIVSHAIAREVALEAIVERVMGHAPLRVAVLHVAAEDPAALDRFFQGRQGWTGGESYEEHEARADRFAEQVASDKVFFAALIKDLNLKLE